jgi:hypothetical protein
VSTVEAQQRFEATQQSASLCNFTTQISVESVKPNVKADQELTMFSVCSGIGSGMHRYFIPTFRRSSSARVRKRSNSESPSCSQMAIERAGLRE